VPQSSLRIALLGGVPPSLGGGGLEVQMARTATALERRGHEVFHVAREPAARAFDVLHAFSAEPDVWQWLAHWRRNPAPLVVSPVVVVAPGRSELRQRLGARLPIPAFGPRMRAQVLHRAVVAVALTQHEARLLRMLAAGKAPRIVVIPNGVDPAPAGDADLAPFGLPAEYVLLLGTVSARKRQAETIAALGENGPAPVVVGGFDGDAAAAEAFTAQVGAAGGRWLGELDDAGTVRALVREAVALVHFSDAEGQSLAVLEALAEGTPVIAAPLPANRELAARHPGHVSLVDRPEQLPGVLAALGPRPPERPQLPTWDDVAASLDALYRDVGAGSPA
jgi:glycosyltransferase involved in cell wall biosynthesis